MAKKSKRFWWLIGLGGIVIILIIISMIQQRNRPKGVSVTTELVAKHDIREIVTASGKIFPENEVKISSDVSGEIIALYVREGDTVKAGQLLAKINADTYLPSVQRGEASVKSSKAQENISDTQIKAAKAQQEEVNARLANAQKVHERNKKLFEDGVISQADLEASQSSLDGLIASAKSAAASLRQAQENASASKYGTMSARANLDELKTSLSKTFIYAPVDGVISSLNVEKGERVVGTIQMSGTEMMTIANLNSIEVQVEVSENDIVRVEKGNPATIEVDAFYGRKFNGVVTEIANSSTASSSTNTTASLNTDQVTNFIVKIRMDLNSYKDMIIKGKPFPFRPGMSASAEINTRTEHDVLSVPIQAVTTREDPSGKRDEKSGKKADLIEVVFLQQGDTVNMVPVKTGIQDDEYIHILSGLKEKDRVVTGPYSTVSRTLKQGSVVHEDTKKKGLDKEDKEEEQ
ncbi:MAG TPA: efflux RND transporter periplasmic adaptor subunit [Saprospiraceae bacterium]|nr:MAG: RND family efflux transporter MFP subunit [Candidatus Parvibacillus calidus]MCC7148731.1 efflux RND transporter periplasmic adaptor subunit [Saprospiraceae bacterium]HRP83742.1 efflux RND transporter periplasmic adaptor subunit [Saprospiraceae bacterium]